MNKSVNKRFLGSSLLRTARQFGLLHDFVGNPEAWEGAPPQSATAASYRDAAQVFPS